MAEFNYLFIPKYLDDPPQVLFWPLDEAVIFMVFLFAGVMWGKIIYFFIAGIVCWWYVRKLKSSEQDGFLFHWLWWNGVSNIKGFPPSHIREFRE